MYARLCRLFKDHLIHPLQKRILYMPLCLSVSSMYFSLCLDPLRQVFRSLRSTLSWCVVGSCLSRLLPISTLHSFIVPSFLMSIFLRVYLKKKRSYTLSVDHACFEYIHLVTHTAVKLKKAVFTVVFVGFLESLYIKVESSNLSGSLIIHVWVCLWRLKFQNCQHSPFLERMLTL